MSLKIAKDEHKKVEYIHLIIQITTELKLFCLMVDMKKILSTLEKILLENINEFG